MSEPDASSTPERYGPGFYEQMNTRVLASANRVVPMVLEYVQPKSVVDVGCGTGNWLSAFRKHGIDEVQGLDGPWVKEAMLQIPAERFRRADLEQPIRLDRRFDLVVSVEVAEHLPEARAATFIASLAGLGPVVLFSAAIPRQGGTHHVNEQWPEYWAALFAGHGYVPVDCLRKRLWDQQEVAVWYKQNLFFFVEKTRLAQYPRLQQEMSASPYPLSIVHPEMFTSAATRPPDLKDLTLRQAVTGLPYLTGRFLRRQLARLTNNH